MAEVLVGPLVSLAVYLSSWIYQKWQTRTENKQHNYETAQLVRAVDNLAIFAQTRSITLQHHRGTVWASTLTDLAGEIDRARREVYDTLEDGKLKGDVKRRRIERIQSCLTQSLVLHFGVAILEVLSSVQLM
jgi:hypothetical protein